MVQLSSFLLSLTSYFCRGSRLEPQLNPHILAGFHSPLIFLYLFQEPISSPECLICSGHILTRTVLVYNSANSMLSDPAASWFAALVLTGRSLMSTVRPLCLQYDPFCRFACFLEDLENIVSEQQLQFPRRPGNTSSSQVVLLSFCVCHYGQLQPDPWSSWKETPPPRTETQTKPCYCEVEAISSSVSGTVFFSRNQVSFCWTCWFQSSELKDSCVSSCQVPGLQAIALPPVMWTFWQSLLPELHLVF